MVTEMVRGTKQNGRPGWDARIEKILTETYFVAAAAMSMLVSLSVSPSTVPFTVT